MTTGTGQVSGLPMVLMDAAAYPHAVTGAVRLIETHISWVLVAPPWAYKIKRPVAFDFLDFRSVTDRRHFCEEELRLNRRFAPAIYQDVVPVTGDADGIRIGGTGPVIDYAVRMAAFGAADELKALVAAGGVEAADLARLARDLAAFQATAEVRRGVDADDPAPLEAAALANFASLRQSPVAQAAGAGLDDLAQWTRHSAAMLRPVMEQRRRDGFVRDGHGDLHAGNIVRWNGRLVPFDCIEFDPRLRCLDVVSDVAFLVMDLQSRDRTDLAQAFLNAWLAATGDFAALRLLPFHVVYLSLVRAKVDALQLADADGDRAMELRQCVEQHLQLARRWALRARRWLILMHGVSGSGKSWMARRLALLLPAVEVRADIERKRLAGIAETASSGSGPGGGIYTPAFSDSTYARLLDCAAAALAGGQHVIVDATFLDPQRRLPFRELADRWPASLVIVHCTPPADVCRARVAARAAAGTDASEAGVAILDHQLAGAAPLAPDERVRAVQVTGEAPDPAAVARRIAALAS